jgi:hypothetical protein
METVVQTITSYADGIIDRSMVCPLFVHELPPETLFSRELLVFRTAHHRLLDLLAAIRIILIDRPFDRATLQSSLPPCLGATLT